MNQETRWVRFMKKTKGQKSRETIPLRRYYESTIHSYILEQLSYAAPRNWVHLCLILGKDCSPFAWWGCAAPFSSQTWRGPPWLGLPQFRYQQVVCSDSSYITHSSPPQPLHKFWHFYTCCHYGCITIYCIYTCIHIIQSFFLFSFLTSKQVSWPRTLMSGTLGPVVNICTYCYFEVIKKSYRVQKPAEKC